ncbi:DUF883 family protein [Methylacidiphilum caldifontis]|uniref:DUF883 domain-containing protein n=1 Tax=Methylacidiphilum caldifontis TaxID=2795386 RepID=A0A4Y8P9R8_9BACT|nr:DUF883 family protein [Methylacidiphilum caldifontis]QSR87943.1 DUF883 domain-containing protein [Methylacidiphilum caldifontis]TFE67062.1 hypothetical protein A7Q10_10015 [Methylacidiphilum caldifontis]
MMNEFVSREKLINDIKAVLHDADVLVKSTAGDIGEKTKDAIDRLNSKLNSLRDYLSNSEDWLVDKTKERVKSTDEIIRKNPYQSIGISLLVGIAIGIILGRK